MSLEFALQSGWILGHAISRCTADHTAHTVSPVFDRWDNIGWDCWVIFGSTTDLTPPPSEFDFTLSWMPKKIVPLVDEAMFGPDDCLVWIPPERLSLTSS